MKFASVPPAWGGTFLSFGAMQAMQLALPLLVLPWLARQLDPYAFGLLLYMLLLSPLVALLVDWGLTTGGARAASRCREHPDELSAILGTALWGRAIMIGVTLLAALVLWRILPHAREEWLLYWLAILWGIVRGLNPLWFCQGAGVELATLAKRDVAASLTVLVLVILLVNSSGRAWIYPFLLIVCKSPAFGSIWFEILRQFRPRGNLHDGFSGLRSTSFLSGTAFAQIMSWNGCQMLLGYFLSPTALGIIAATAKMARALASLVNPVTQTLFPALCREETEARRRKILRASLLGSFAGAVTMAGICWALAPLLMKIALATTENADIWVLRAMLVAVPLMVVNNVLSQQILAPLGHEKQQLQIQCLGALMCFLAVAILAMTWGMAGGACFPAVLESLLMCGYGWQIFRLCPRTLL